MSKVELYTKTCNRCQKIFGTDNPDDKSCPTCKKHSSPHRVKKKKIEKKPLSLNEILHVAEVYRRVKGKYINYGETVALVENNSDRCVCCGATVPEGRQVCPKCERL